jgi:hypothetical protein
MNIDWMGRSLHIPGPPPPTRVRVDFFVAIFCCWCCVFQSGCATAVAFSVLSNSSDGTDEQLDLVQFLVDLDNFTPKSVARSDLTQNYFFLEIAKTREVQKYPKRKAVKYRVFI